MSNSLFDWKSAFSCSIIDLVNKIDKTTNADMSQYSGFSTASRLALAKKDEEMIKERQESAAQIAKLQAIILEKTIPVNLRGNSTRGRPCGSRGGGGSRGSYRGAGRGGRGLDNWAAGSGLQLEEFTNSDPDPDLYPKSDTGMRQKRDSTAISPEIILKRSERIKKKKFWNEDVEDSEGGSESEQDPRQGPDWKISRRSGFQKDRERKEKESNKTKRLSKTKKRNSTESMFKDSMDADMGMDIVVVEEIEKTRSIRTKTDEKEVSTEVADLFAHLFDKEVVTQTNQTVIPNKNHNQSQENPAAKEKVVPTASTSAPLVPLAPMATTIHLPEIGTNEKVMSWSTAVGKSAPNLVSNAQQTQPQASKQKSPYIPGQIKPPQEIVVANHDGAWREELEIELRGENGEAFTGTITMTEAKHGIYRDCLGFEDFKNFDGVRFSYKGIRLVTFKLKEQMDVDSLVERRHFDYKRPVKRNGKMEFTTIRCKIRGLRSEGLKDYLERKEMQKSKTQEDGSTQIKITGCEYKVSSQQLKEVLSHWGTVTSEPKEEVFHDPHDTDGTNRTGVYVVRMILENEIPELIPFSGLRIKIQHPDIKKLCTSCYGEHLRKTCNKAGRTWFEYVEDFIVENPDITKEFYGSTLERMKKISGIKELTKRRPTLEDFGIPKTKAELDLMLRKMLDCGIDNEMAAGMIKDRKTKFDAACKALDSK